MKKYKCLVAYDGTHYAGFQIQDNAPTIQKTLQEIFSRRLNRPTLITGASRTDATVHALGQVVHFESEPIADCEKFIYQINCMLPPDIRLLQIEEVSATFHSRYDAKRKTYYYHLSLNPHSPPFGHAYKLFLPRQISIEAMKQAAAYFIGTHDFKALANHNDQGCAKNCSVKTIYRFDFIDQGDDIRVEVEGNGFLHKMIRNMIGLLIEIGKGNLSKETIPLILASKDRRHAGQTAPGHPLFLARITY
jgi:tRNA pseudouridine38-40 synthase